MKKLYTLLASLLVTVGAFANFNVSVKDATPGALKMPKVTFSLKNDVKAEHVNAVSAVKASPAKVHVINTIDDMAGDWILDYMDMYEGTTGSKKITVSVVEGTTDKVNITDFFDGITFQGTVNLKTGKMTIAKQSVGTHQSYGTMSVSRVNISSGTPSVSSLSLSCTLDLSTSTITLPSNTYIGLSVSAGFFDIYGNCEMKYFDFDPASEVVASVTECPVDDNVVVSFSAGENVKDILFDIYAGHFTNAASNLSIVLDNGALSLGGTVLEGFPLSVSGMSRGIYTMFFIGVDDEGNILDGKACHFFFNEDNDNEWKEGFTAKYCDDYLSSAYKNMDDVERDVTVQEHSTVAGFYRVVNPLATHSKKVLSSHSTLVEGDHDHYLYIHAEDPEKVYIEDSAMGWSYGDEDGMLVATSYVQFLKDNESTDDEITEAGVWGTLENNQITFPEDALLQYFMHEGKYYYANSNSAFKLTLPEKDAVKNIAVDADNASAEYFNMQGMRVNQPVAGNLYIVRQGSKVSKQIVK